MHVTSESNHSRSLLPLNRLSTSVLPLKWSQMRAVEDDVFPHLLCCYVFWCHLPISTILTHLSFANSSCRLVTQLWAFPPTHTHKRRGAGGICPHLHLIKVAAYRRRRHTRSSVRTAQSDEATLHSSSAPRTSGWDSAGRRCSRDRVPRESSCPARIPGVWHEQSRSCERQFWLMSAPVTLDTARHPRCSRRTRRLASGTTWHRRNHGLWQAPTKRGSSRSHHRWWGVSWSRNGMCSAWSASAWVFEGGLLLAGLALTSEESHCVGTRTESAECLRVLGVGHSTCCDRCTSLHQPDKPATQQVRINNTYADQMFNPSGN